MNIPRWLELAQQFDKDNLKYVDPQTMVSYTNGISVIYKNSEWVYKRSIPFLAENEIYFLDVLSHTEYVPFAERFDKYTILLALLENEPITNPTIFEYHCKRFLTVLERHGIKHGDLTEANIFVRDNKPIVIDWAEARFANDPRPSKRLEGDTHWMLKTMGKLIHR